MRRHPSRIRLQKDRRPPIMNLPSTWTRLARQLPIAAVLLVITCGQADQDQPGEPATDVSEQTKAASPSSLSALPVRDGARVETTGSVPHQQIGVAPVPAVDAELRRRAFSLPAVSDRASERSLPGARGLWLSEDIAIVRPEVLGGSREFAHIHPDGSLHIWLPVERAIEVDEANWGELHPWVGRPGFWDGVSMVYTPRTADEVEVVMQIIVNAYNFVTGENIEPVASS